MDFSSAISLISTMLLMFLVVWTGTAWFIAFHPKFVWRMIQRTDGSADAPQAFDQRALRVGAVWYGAVGLALILLSDLYAQV
jgi:hypothetical protein